VFLLAALIVILVNPLRVRERRAVCLKWAIYLRGSRSMWTSSIRPPLRTPARHAAAVARQFGWPLITTFLILVWVLPCVRSAQPGDIARAAGGDSVHADLVATDRRFSLFVMWRNDFGQREYLFVLGLLPYCCGSCDWRTAAWGCQKRCSPARRQVSSRA
jgi:hypothetical protein